MNTTADWKKIKAEYISTDTSYRKLAEKYGIPFRTLAQRAKRENWVELRNRNTDRVVTKMITQECQRQVDRYSRMLTVTDKLLSKIEASIELLDAEGVTLDKSGIRALAGAIKDIKEIQSLKSELDIREQEARIAKLQKESEEEKEETNEVVIRIEGYDESWSQ